MLGLNTSRCPECGRVQSRQRERAREGWEVKKRLWYLRALFGGGTLLLLGPVLIVATKRSPFQRFEEQIVTVSLVFAAFAIGFACLLAAGEAVASSQWASAIVTTIGIMLLLLVTGCCGVMFVR
jgi:hypothetical protein